MKRIALVCILAAAMFGHASGQKFTIVQNDKYTITAHNIKMAIEAATGTDIGSISLNNSSIGPDKKELPEDGYVLLYKHGTTYIYGKDKALVYGVCGLLKDYYGIDYWGDGQYYVSGDKKKLPEGRIVKNFPTFRYRQTQNYLLQKDTLYKWWYRLEEPSEEFADNLWVHTCNRLLPADRYGKNHPEYYAFYGGRRHPGSASQWCMSNPDVLEIVCERLDSLFKANPGLNTISISQNDGSDTYCRCPECLAAIEEEGSPSGPILRFINKVADRFPDKTISTLAYLFSVQPPKVTKPRKNVSIMLCDIDCRRQTALTENPSGQEFMRALEGWSKICDNLFVWDYGINFDNYLSPFPNLSTLGYNMKIFKEHGVKMHFSQIASTRGGDMAELRTYLTANLMWNADADCDSLVRHFLKGYYGAAAEPLYRYLRVMEGAAVGTDVDLFIYDSPVSYKDNILRPALMRRYNEYFDQAESLVTDAPELLARVRRSRLPLMYSALEIARTDPEMDRTAVKEALDLFEARCKEFEVPMLNERHNPPLEYVQLYRDRYLSPNTANLARGKSVTYLIEPRPKYLELSKKALTDGVYGGTTYVENWVGWEGTDGAFVIDLEEDVSVSSISCDFLHQIGAWILLPEAVSYSTSADGVSWQPFYSESIPEKRTGKVEFIAVEGKVGKPGAPAAPVAARYIKVEVVGTKTCPTWHYGVGNPSWFFIDEVTVN